MIKLKYINSNLYKYPINRYYFNTTNISNTTNTTNNLNNLNNNHTSNSNTNSNTNTNTTTSTNTNNTNTTTSIIHKNDHKPVFNIPSNQPIRVRFAPSPTGELHLGSLRTALYNKLIARKYNGIFIIRIEDTDKKRYVDGSIERLLEILKWAGIDYNEGPYKLNDNNMGPYIQSERLDIYKKYANILIEKKKAYYCFCNDNVLSVY